jgi:ATP-dependent protease ClpP protease subunit
MARGKPKELALIGEVDEWEGDVVAALLEIPAGGECVFHFDSGGGSVYGALAVTTLIRHRRLRCTGIVLGECSSATLLVFAACQRRLVTRYSTLFFHRMRWQSEKRVGSQEAFLWAKHFDEMEKSIDDLQARLFGNGEELIRTWIDRSQYVSGAELAAAGLAELFDV